MGWLKNEVLEGSYVVLEPLQHKHIEDLQEAVIDGESWKLWFANVPSPSQMPIYVNQAIHRAQQGDIAYAVRSKLSNTIVGTTRYYNVDEKNQRALIGYTWYCASARRTVINTECKYLLLQALFENYNAIAVEFRIHHLNQSSRAAVERLGGKLDGILRSHMIMRDGSLRDTACYSIIACEWPAVKMNLCSKIVKYE